MYNISVTIHYQMPDIVLFNMQGENIMRKKVKTDRQNTYTYKHRLTAAILLNKE